MADNRLALVEALRHNVEDIKRFFITHEREFVVRQLTGTVSVYAILLRKFPPNMVSGGYNKTNFIALIGNVQCEGLDEKKKIPGGCNLDVIGPSNADENKRNPDFDPQEYPIKSFQPYYLSLLIAPLDNINPMDLVLLTGISAKASKSDNFGAPKIFLNVQSVTPVKEARTEDLYAALSGMKTIGIKPCSLNYNPDASYDDRYDTSNPVILDCTSGEPDSIPENGTFVTALVSDDADNWKYKEKDQSDHMRAVINYCAIEMGEEKRVNSLIRVSYYSDLLQDFQITNKDSPTNPTKLKLWEKLGPVIFEHLDHKVLCKLDVK